MITPRFDLSQTDNTLTIKIRAPYCSLRDLEISVDETEFVFICKPYYLRLNLPGSICENDNTRSKFDADNGEFTFSYEKEKPGEHFEDLSFVTKFLVTKVDVTEGERSLIVETSEDSKDKNEIDDINDCFGFALTGHKRFLRISSEFDDVFEVNPSEVNLSERKKLRIQFEQGKFNVNHYLGDLNEDDEILEIISLKSPWKDLAPSSIKFDEKELDFLKDLPNIQYNLSENQLKYCYYGLIDILYAFCYDQRTTYFEGTIESGWTITKLASTFCWLDTFENIKDTLISLFRRSLIYPLYRNFNLSQVILQDLKDLLNLGEIFIIKCLIKIYNVFLKGDCCRYILNDLFIKDYIVYIMKWDKNKWKTIVDELHSVEINKAHLGLNLNEIEKGFGLDEMMNSLKIYSSDSDDTSDSDSDDSTDSDTSDSDSDIAKSIEKEG